MNTEIGWDVVFNMIDPRLFIIVVLLWCIGLFLKKTPFFTDEWKIPFILLAISILVTLAYLVFVLGQGLTPAVIVVGFIQGILCAAVAVFSNELIKQITIKRFEA